MFPVLRVNGVLLCVRVLLFLLLAVNGVERTQALVVVQRRRVEVEALRVKDVVGGFWGK